MKTTEKKLTKKEATLLATKEAAVTYANYTKETVEQINVCAEKSLLAYIKAGKLVYDYVQRVTKKETVCVNAHWLLSQESGSAYSESMLRKLEAAYKLRVRMEKAGKAVDVSFSHMLTVVHSGLNADKQYELLSESKKNNSSVSQLKKRVKIENSAASAPVKVGIDSEASAKKVISSLGQCFADLSLYNTVRKNDLIPEDMQKAFDNLIDLAKRMGIKTSSESNNSSNITVNSVTRKAA